MTTGANGWRGWQWTGWAVASVVVAAVVDALSWLLHTFGDVCGSSDDPVPAAVHQLQLVLLVLMLSSIGGWALVARFTGRWWVRAALSATVTVALPALWLATHLTTASWAPVGFCMM